MRVVYWDGKTTEVIHKIIIATGHSVGHTVPTGELDIETAKGTRTLKPGTFVIWGVEEAKFSLATMGKDNVLDIVHCEQADNAAVIHKNPEK